MRRDLGFAFNDKDFSDRILRIEVEEDSLDSNSDSKGSDLDCVADPWIKKLSRKQKQRSKKTGGDPNYYYDRSKCASDVNARSLYICSAILAGSSPFFYKLFKNDMRESSEKVVTLRIDTYEEELALMDVLEFIYSNTLHATSIHQLVYVLVVADMFEVRDCVGYCCEILMNMPMSLESAFCYLELPSSVSMSEEVRYLIDVAKERVASHYKDFTKSREEAMDLPLSAIEAILESQGLQVFSEDDVFDFVLEWARAHYPVLEERRKVLTKRLARFIYFQNMSSSKLKEVLACPDFDHEKVSKLVMEAVFSKVDHSCGQHIHPSKDLAATTDCGFSGRVYRPHCVVYFDLEKDELKRLHPGSGFNSQPFYLGGKCLYLFAQLMKEDKLLKQPPHLGLFVNRAKGTEACTLDIEFGVINNSSKKFISKFKANNVTFSHSHGLGTENILGLLWTDLMNGEDEYFIDNVLHLQAELTLKSHKA